MTTAHLLLVEGVPGIGKSTLLDALLRRHVAACPPRKLRTLVHLSQAHTYGPLAPGEDAGTLTVAQSVEHLDTIASFLEWQVRALAGQRVPKLFALVDTLHLTHCHRPGVVRWSDVAGIDERLAALGVKLLFLHARPETIWQRCIAARRDEPFMTDYALRRFGPTPEDVHRHLVGEQEAMRAHLRETRLPHRSVAVDGELEGYVEEAEREWRG